MNIKNLEVGTIYKNYKSICAELSEPIKEGKSRQLQIKDWERYFEFKKSGHSFIIEKIYDEPIEKVDLRKEGNNKTKYIGKIETLILDLLAQEANKGQVFISKNKLLQQLSMVNENYSFGKYKTFKLSSLIDITTKEIYDFYEISDSMLKRNLEAAINSLKNQSLLTCEEVKTVCVVNTDLMENMMLDVKATKYVRKDVFGDEEIALGIHDPNQKLTHRKANVVETQAIIGAQRDVLLKYGCKEISEIFKKNLADDFYREVNEILFEDLNILFYYNSYEIISNKDRIIKELESEERLSIMKNLNSEIIDKLNSNTEERHKQAFGKYDETHKGKYKVRMSFDYIKNSKQLVKLLVDKDAQHIRIK